MLDHIDAYNLVMDTLEKMKKDKPFEKYDITKIDKNIVFSVAYNIYNTSKDTNVKGAFKEFLNTINSRDINVIKLNFPNNYTLKASDVFYNEKIYNKIKELLGSKIPDITDFTKPESIGLKKFFTRGGTRKRRAIKHTKKHNAKQASTRSKKRAAKLHTKTQKRKHRT
jgi:hypothetical protein